MSRPAPIRRRFRTLSRRRTLFTDEVLPDLAIDGLSKPRFSEQDSTFVISHADYPTTTRDTGLMRILAFRSAAHRR